MQPPMNTRSADDFQTPKSALKPLLPYIKKNWTIWECAGGSGNLADELGRLSFKHITTDIIYTDEEFPKKMRLDFLTEKQTSDYDCIITNPPYSKKGEFIKRAYELGKPFAFLMPLTILETDKRQSLFKKYGIEILLLKKRINFETPSGKGTGSWFATAWFCWKLLPKQINYEADTESQGILAQIPTLSKEDGLRHDHTNR